MPVAWVLSTFSFRGRGLLRALAVVPFVLPTVVVASAFLAILGPRSPLNGLLQAVLGPNAPRLDLSGTVLAIVLATVFYDVSVVVRLVGGLWSHLDPRTAEAARILGANGPRTFREVTWPLLRPAVLSAATIVFLFSVTSFGIVLLLGGQGQATLEVEIWRSTAILLDLPTAAALSLLQMGTILVLLLLDARAQERLSIAQRLRPRTEVARPPRQAGERAAVVAVAAGLVVLVALPLATLVERSLAASGSAYSLQAYQALLEPGRRTGMVVPAIRSVIDSLAFASATLVLAGGLGLSAGIVVGYRRGWLARAFDAMVMLPLGTSAVTVGFGFIVALDSPPLDLRTSVAIIPIAHAIVALPFVVRATAPIIRSIDPRLREAAAVLGASGWRSWREVDAPIVARAALVGAGFAFAVSLGEFGATLFIARPDTPTIPVTIARLLGLPGPLNFAQAMAMSTILMLLTGVSVLVIERLRGGGPQPF
jgi:thiamine transport system permease protein